MNEEALNRVREAAWRSPAVFADDLLKFDRLVKKGAFMDEAVQRMIESREIAVSGINAAQDRSESAFGPAQVSAIAALASAVLYLGDAAFLCFQPTVSALDPPSVLENHLQGLRELADQLGNDAETEDK